MRRTWTRCRRCNAFLFRSRCITEGQLQADRLCSKSIQFAASATFRFIAINAIHSACTTFGPLQSPAQPQPDPYISPNHRAVALPAGKMDPASPRLFLLPSFPISRLRPYVSHPDLHNLTKYHQHSLDGRSLMKRLEGQSRSTEESRLRRSEKIVRGRVGKLWRFRILGTRRKSRSRKLFPRLRLDGSEC
jgi:hypothetical protein